MTLRYDTVSFLTDYGIADEFVGVCKSVIRSIVRGVEIIDVSHSVPRYDVRAGGLALARAAQYLCPGVVLAVVDPGVATSRKAVAIEVGDGQSVLVGPDNGLLAPAVAMVGGATRAVELTAFEFHLPGPGSTFDGRDVFAPVAAHLCAGIPLDQLGEAIDPHLLVPAVLPVSERDGDSMRTEVLWVDHFGNVQLNADPDELHDWGGTLALRIGDDVRPLTLVGSYATIPSGELGLLIDSYGMVSLATDRASAAAELRLGVGDTVTLGPRGGPRAGHHQGRAVSAEGLTNPMRPMTTLVMALLLATILIASVVQLFFLAR